MKKQELIDLGVSEDIIEKVLALHGKGIEKFKTDLATVQQERDQAREQLKTAETQIEDFKKMDIDGIKKAADDYKAAAETARTDADKRVAELKFSHALEAALTGAQAKNAKAVEALLSKDLLKLNDADGTISGLNEQLEKIKTDNPFLFDDYKEPPKITTTTNNQPVLTDAFTQSVLKGAGLPAETLKEK